MEEKDNKVNRGSVIPDDHVAGSKWCVETCVTSMTQVGIVDSSKPDTVDVDRRGADEEIGPEVFISEAVAAADTPVGVNGKYESDVHHCIEVVDPWCDLCYEETRQKIVAEAFCPECNSFMCKSCIGIHKKVPASRKHRVQHGESMPKSQSDKPVKLQECEIHAGNQCDRFCFNHDSMICDHCVQDCHQQCEAANIVDICQNLDQFDMQLLRDAVCIVKKAAVENKILLEQNFSKIENQKKVMTKKAEGVRDEIIRLIKHQFSQTVANIEEKCREKYCSLTKYISSLAKAIQDLDETISDIDKTITANIDPLNFIHFHDIAKRAQQQKIEIESMQGQLSKIDIFFVTSSKTLAELGSFKYLGEVKEVASESYALKRIPDICFPPATRRKTEAMPKNKKVVQVTKLQPLMGKAPNNKISYDITSTNV